MDLRESVVEVGRVNNKLMTIKLVVGECTLNVVSVYAPQARLDEDVKRSFWEGLDEIVRNISPADRLFIGGDFNEHIGSSAGGYSEVHIGFGFGGTEGIDYLPLKRCDRGLCKDCKVIPDETLATQHRFLVMEAGIMIRKKKRSVRGRPRIGWSAKDKDQELEGRLSTMWSWKSSGDASIMWSTMADCIRKAGREVLGVSSG
nr:uncharacterized protein LOC104105330 [Nicotiana tomentosiformis]